MSSSSMVNPRIKRFDGSNYIAWKNRVYTELLCDDLTDFVDKKPTEEIKKKSFGTEKKPLSWAQADARARRIIIENLDDSVLHYPPPELSAYEIWRRLKATYNRTSYFQHAYLRRKLSNLTYDGKSDLGVFFREFDETVAEIRSSGGKVGRMDDIETVVIMLSSLPSDFSPVVASLGDINENNPVSLESLKGLLLDFDLKRSDERKAKKLDAGEKVNAAYLSDANSESALLSDSRNKQRFDNRGEKLHCDFCGRDGHREVKCFKKRAERRALGSTRGSTEANLGEGSKSGPRAVSFMVEVDAADAEKTVHGELREMSFIVEEKVPKIQVK